MKILFLSMHYKPEPCDTRTSQLAEALAVRGHETQALTSFPNYPFGKVYDGYKQRPAKRELIEGVQVTRVPMLPDHSMSAKRRALSYLSFGFSAALIGAFVTRRPDLIWIHHPPLTTGIAGFLLAKVKRVPYVYEIHDLWPETLTSTGMITEGRITKAIRGVCDFLHKRANAVVVTSEGMKRHLAGQGLNDAKIHVFPQWTAGDEKALPQKDQAFGAEHGLTGKFNIIYTGNLGVAQELDTVLDAARKLQDLQDVQIVFVGAGIELKYLQRRVSRENIANVKFTGQVDRSLVPSFLTWADGLLVHLKNDPLFSITIPSKTQVYMAAGKPVLCGVSGDASDLVESTGGGICFSPQDASAMEDAIRRLYTMSPSDREQLGRNARRGYEQTCSRETLVLRYEELFESIVSPKQHLNVVLAEAEDAREAA
jgi:colanic acid biosynthesis glycosyl transferase WcaI